MTTMVWTLVILALIFLSARFMATKIYDIKLIPHSETPDKFGFHFEEHHFPTQNNRSLYGWWVPAENDSAKAPTLILVHGWNRNLGRMLRYIEHLHPRGYNLLAFDARHHGSSDKDGHASMYKFGQDVQAAVKHVRTLDIDPDRIGVLGLSIGGAGSIYAAGIEPSIKAVVTVGAPAHPVDVMRREFKRHHLPGFLIWIILKQLEWQIGAKYSSFAPSENIAKSAAAFLIIHGADDRVVLPSQGEKLHQAAQPNRSELWQISDFAHSNCHHEPTFWDRVHKFLTNQL